MKIYLTPLEIKNIVANLLHVTVEQIDSRSRERKFVKARHIAMFYSRDFTDLTLAKIGKEIGGKDHATVLYAIKSIKGQSDIYKAFRGELHKIECELILISDNEFEKYKLFDTDKV